MHIITLDKKLMRVQHKLTKQQVDEIQRKHEIDGKRMESEIRHQLYSEFMKGIAKNIPTIMQTDEDSLTYTISGYVLSDRQMMETILEICEFDDDTKIKMIKQIQINLGIYA